MIQLKLFIKKNKTLLKFHLLLNLLTAVFITLSSYIHIPLNSLLGITSYFLHFCILQFTVFGFIYLLSVNKYLFTFLFPSLFFILSIVGYWGYTHDITVDSGVIQASFETKPYIILELISVPLLLYSLAVIFSIIYILKQYNKIRKKSNVFFLIISLLGVFTYFFLDSYRYNTLGSRLPYNVINGIIDYSKEPKVNYKKIEKNLNKTINDINFIIILGESVRADHLGINGYKRNTTPLLNKIEDIISFDNLFTNRSYTSISIPQILSDEPMHTLDEFKEYTSLIDVANSAGMSTVWIGNQVPETSFNYFIENSAQKVLIDPFRSVYSYNNTSDLELLPHFYNFFQELEQKFIILHMLGSHWMYHKRYDKNFEHFTPTAKSKYLPSNSRDEMINAYDNTILLLDYFINDIIHHIKKQDDKTILIYLSDHGEALGEDGKYLHAFRSPAIENPAGMIWLSPLLKQSNPKLFKQINSIKNSYIELDFLFPTVLDILGIQDIDYEKEKSLLHNN